MKNAHTLAFVFLALLVTVGPAWAQPAHAISKKVKAARVNVTKPPVLWPPQTPDGFVPITWVQARGIRSFVAAPDKSGFSDYLTFIYLPYNKIKAIVSTTPRVAWGNGVGDFAASSARDWAFPKMVVETAKLANKRMKFLWDMPFHNVTLETTDLSLAFKSSDATGEYVASGSRPAADVSRSRRMLVVNNKKIQASIMDFDETSFIKDGDQAIEGFAPDVLPTNTPSTTARLLVGVRPDKKTLVVFCSRAASLDEASQALTKAGVPVEDQLEADGGLSTTCAYNLPGQYFVEPGRMLPALVGAFPR